jgi:hypothetical protein
MTRVTLDIDEDLLVRVKERAAAENTTVEEMVQRFLKVVAQPFRREDLPPITRSALGLFKGLPDRPYKELLEEALLERYGPLK